MGDGHVEPNCRSARDTLLMYLIELTATLSFSHSQRWLTVYFQQSLRYVHLCQLQNGVLNAIYKWMVGAPGTVPT